MLCFCAGMSTPCIYYAGYYACKAVDVCVSRVCFLHTVRKYTCILKIYFSLLPLYALRFESVRLASRDQHHQLGMKFDAGLRVLTGVATGAVPRFCPSLRPPCSERGVRINIKQLRKKNAKMKMLNIRHPYIHLIMPVHAVQV